MRFNSYDFRMNRLAERLRLVFISLTDVAAYSSPGEANLKPLRIFLKMAIWQRTVIK
jgi:hypothetical protein